MDNIQSTLVERQHTGVANDDDNAVGALVNAFVDSATLVLETTSADDDQSEKVL